MAPQGVASTKRNSFALCAKESEAIYRVAPHKAGIKKAALGAAFCVSAAKQGLFAGGTVGGGSSAGDGGLFFASVGFAGGGGDVFGRIFGSVVHFVFGSVSGFGNGAGGFGLSRRGSAGSLVFGCVNGVFGCVFHSVSGFFGAGGWGCGNSGAGSRCSGRRGGGGCSGSGAGSRGGGAGRCRSRSRTRCGRCRSRTRCGRCRSGRGRWGGCLVAGSERGGSGNQGSQGELLVHRVCSFGCGMAGTAAPVEKGKRKSRQAVLAAFARCRLYAGAAVLMRFKKITNPA